MALIPSVYVKPLLFLRLFFSFFFLFFFSFFSFSQRSNLLFEETFENEDFSKKWNWINDCCGYSVVRSNDVERAGHNSIRFESRNTDIRPANQVRLTIAKQLFTNITGVPSRPQPSRVFDRWIGVSIFVPTSFTNITETESVLQWQEVPENSFWQWNAPFLSLSTYNGKWAFERLSARYDLGDITKGQWTDWVFRIKFSSGNDGVIEIWKNGELVSSINAPSIGASKAGAWLAAGLVRSPTSQSRHIYMDEIRIGNENAGYNDVAPGGSGVENVNPVANAGNDQEITLPATITLNGTQSYDADGSIIGYSWSRESGPGGVNFTNSSQATTEVSNLREGTYVFKLTVTDNAGATAVDFVTVRVNAKPNTAPVAVAGDDQVITLPANATTFDGGESSDADGSISKYSWVKISGPSGGQLSDSEKAVTEVSGLMEGEYIFELTVTDNQGLTATDRIQIVVRNAENRSPIADAGKDTTIRLPQTNVSLDASLSSDPDGNIVSYNWVQTSGPGEATILNANEAIVTIEDLVQGTYIFRVEVEDDKGAKSSATVAVVVKAETDDNQLPQVSITNNFEITLPDNKVTLSAEGSIDPDGQIVSYQWTKQSGPDGTVFSAGDQMITEVNDLVEGTYVFRLTIIDNNGGVATGTVTVRVNGLPNQLPTANAGADQTITLPVNRVTLRGGNSRDTDGSIASYSWVKISGPSEGRISTSAGVNTSVINLVVGTYIFELTVTDDKGGIGKDQVRVVVNPIPNKAPVAKAGEDQTIALPTNAVTLSASTSSDEDGEIVRYAWSKVSGPAGGAITSPSNVSTNITGLLEGVYVYKVQVTDNSGSIAEDFVSITVLPAPNQTPVAIVSGNQTITLPVNAVTVNGNGSYDPDGTIRSYSWSKVSGPVGGTIANPAAAATQISGLTAGNYVFRLVVVDNRGATGSVTLTIRVNGIPNKAPVANAGNNISIQLPTSSATLSASASYDSDGTIVSYLWSKISGPTAGRIVNPESMNAAIRDLVVGRYIFQVKVTDNNGASSYDSVTVQVRQAANKVPIADAGEDQVITISSISLKLNGSKSYDPDGTIISYSWNLVSGPSEVKLQSSTDVEPGVTGLIAGDYIFKLTVKDNKNATASDTVKISVVNNFRSVDETLTIFPNPATSVINVRFFNESEKKVRLTIHDVTGRIVVSKEELASHSYTTSVFDVSTLAKGSYFIIITDETGGKRSKTFIKQ